MNTDTTWQINSSGSDDTLLIAERLGQKCKGGELFLLASDLGGGKTTFTKGLAKGLGSTDNVSSPTFTVSKIYKCRDGIELHHFDFYRLNEGGMAAMELQDYLNDSKIVTVVEWGDVIDDQLPAERVTVRLERASSGENDRLVIISLPKKFAYLA